MHLPEHEHVIDWLGSHGYAASALRRSKALSDGSRLHVLAQAYQRRLETAAPRLAFVVSFYSLEGMAFVFACRRLGIPVVDLQHGVQGELHPAYAGWAPPPTGDRHVLLPDWFWVWSAWEADVIAQWSAGSGHSAVVGGNPWMSIWQPGSLWPGVKQALEGAAALRDRALGKPSVLITLQFGLDPSEQIEPLAKLIREAGSRLAVWVRLHPAMLERREEIRARLSVEGQFELDACTDLPLQAVLSVSDVHLTHSSTAVIEAAQFGVRSVLTSPYGAELFASLLESGTAVVECGGPADLTSRIEQLALGGRGQLEATNASSIGVALDFLFAAAPPNQDGENA